MGWWIGHGLDSGGSVQVSNYVLLLLWKVVMLITSHGRYRFQMVSLLELATVTEEGVKFLSPHDGMPMYILGFWPSGNNFQLLITGATGF